MTTHPFSDDELRTALSRVPAARRLGISPSTLDRLVREHKIVPVRMGSGRGRPVYPLRLLDDYRRGASPVHVLNATIHRRALEPPSRRFSVIEIANNRETSEERDETE